MGTPFVAPCFGAVTEFVRNKYNGLLVDTNDVAKIADAIEWAFSHKLEVYQMQDRLLELIKQSITPTVMISNLQRVYMELYNSRSASL